ncbi:MAG: hypothetical protein AAF533_00315 [Acidobacteriota bacterium]
MGKRWMTWVALVSISCLGLNARAQETCDDGADDDGDGLIDCFDPDCHDDSVACGESFVTSGPETVDCGPRPLALQELWRVPGSQFLTVLVGDIDGDSETEVFVGEPELAVHDGRTGALEGRVLPGTDTVGGSFSMGDVDLDGTVEIFGGSHGVNTVGAEPHDNSLARYEHDLSVSYLRAPRIASTFSVPPLGLADLDHDGFPELQQVGALRDPVDGALLLDLRPDFLFDSLPFSANALAVDLLPDGACATCAGLEVTTGNRVYGVDLATATWELAAELSDVPGSPSGMGPFAVADWNGDQALDIILARSRTAIRDEDSTVNVWDPRTQRRLVTEHVGAPTDHVDNTPLVADLDGDCEPELVLLVTQPFPDTRAVLRVLDNDLSVVREIPNEENSDWSSAVAFDFDADGSPEIVHRGTEYLRIFSALDGSVRAEVPCRSGTAQFERVVIADVDDDGQADLLAGCLDEVVAWTIVDAPPARRVDNQFHYFNVNVEDDLTIPRVQQEHSVAGLHASLDSFLQQSTLLHQGRPASDWCAGDPLIAVADVVTPCAVLPVVLDASASSGCPGLRSYRWLDETGAVACDWSPSPTCEVTASGRYTVEVACSGDRNCSSSANVSFAIRAAAIEAGPDLEVCPGQSVVLRGRVLADCPDPRYEWRDASGVLRPFDRDPSLAITPLASRSYTLVVDCGACLVEDTLRVELAASDLTMPFGAHLRATGGTLSSVDFVWPGARPSAVGEHLHVYRAERARGPFRLVAPTGHPHADLGGGWSDVDAAAPLLFYDLRRANCLEEISASPWRALP